MSATAERALLCAFCLGACAAGGASSVDGIGDVRLKGYLGTRLETMIERHVAATDVDYLTAPFREKTETRGGWQTEFWGKFMHSAVPYLACGDSPRLRANVARGVDSVLASQEACGYIGNYPDDRRMGEGWDVWGVKYTMLGLLHFYDGTRARTPAEIARGDAALAACRRLCDYVIAEIGPNGRRAREVWQTGNWSGYASSSILEPVVWLYRRTREERYLDFAAFLVEGMTKREKGPRLLDKALAGVSVAERNEPDYAEGRKSGFAYACKHGRSKAYEMMSCYQGLLEYVEAMRARGAGDAVEPLMRAAVMTGEDIAKEEVNLSGGCASSEEWFHGASRQHLPYSRLQETCVTTTWMRLCEKLLEMTGEARWADLIERAFYNAYLGALRPDGSVFAAYTPLAGNRSRGMDHCHMHHDCCTANGPRGFLPFLREMFRVRDDGVTVNFYATAQMRAAMPKTGSPVAFDMYSLYPRDGGVRLVSHTDAMAFPLRLRVPAWCPKATVRVNGRDEEGRANGDYLTLTRTWQLGDIVEVKFALPVVAHVLDHAVAFTRGPILLARDSRFADGDMNEPFRRGVKDGQAMASFSEVRVSSDAMWMTFSATLPLGAHHENPEAAKPSTVFFCDFASAGNEWRAGNFYRTWFPIERSIGE